MKRHRENRSRWNFKSKLIEWSVKLVFVDAGTEVMEFHQEDVPLKDIVGMYTDKDRILPENKITYGAYLEEGACEPRVLFRNEFDNGDNARYTEIDTTKTLRDCLYDRQVLEYPEFHVVLSGDVVKQMLSETLVKEKESAPRMAPLDTWLVNE